MIPGLICSISLLLLIVVNECTAGERLFLVIQSTSNNHYKPADEEHQAVTIGQFEKLVEQIDSQTGELTRVLKLRVEKFQELSAQVVSQIPKSYEVVGVYLAGHGNENEFVPSRDCRFSAAEFAPILGSLLTILKAGTTTQPLMVYFEACLTARREGGFLDQLSLELAQPDGALLVGYVDESRFGELTSDRPVDKLLINLHLLDEVPSPIARAFGRVMATVFFIVPVTVNLSTSKVSTLAAILVVSGSAAGFFLTSALARYYRRIPEDVLSHLLDMGSTETSKHVQAIVTKSNERGSIEKIGPLVDVAALSGFLRNGVDGIRNCAERLALPLPFEP